MWGDADCEDDDDGEEEAAEAEADAFDVVYGRGTIPDCSGVEEEEEEEVVAVEEVEEVLRNFDDTSVGEDKTDSRKMMA